ncbi:hypothetical protein BBJ28_00023729 [Nothophytophthora sp. Chile5]|nr:hypothetical protein BBJ28_00023729 [Nothophytophthora sp. Chile5]
MTRNLCYFSREQRCSPVATLQLVHPGACEATSNVQPLCPAACTQAYAPICASNGQVYGNECLFRQAKCLRRDLLAVNIEARALSECGQHL